jgi:hypothetical protein
MVESTSYLPRFCCLLASCLLCQRLRHGTFDLDEIVNPTFVVWEAYLRVSNFSKILSYDEDDNQMSNIGDRVVHTDKTILAACP